MKKYPFKPYWILPGCFDYKIREECKSCKRYGYKATCPPNCESVDYYRKVLPRYKEGFLLVERFEIKDIEKWKELGETSSNVLRKELIWMRNQLTSAGYTISVIFGAGSCKNCPAGCAFPCRFPEKSVVPIEATGINVVKLAKKVANIDIKFPVEKRGYFYRIGMVLYDD